MKNLIDYLGSVYETEKNKYMLQQMLRNETENLNHMKYMIETLKFQQNQQPVIEELPDVKGKLEIFTEGMCGFLKGGVYLAGIWFMIAFVISIFGGANGVSEQVEFLMVFLAIILLIWNIYATVREVNSLNKEYGQTVKEREDIVQKNRKMEENHKKEKERIAVTISDLLVQQNACRRNRQIIKEKISELDNTLNKYYGLNVIFEKYQSFETICKLYEYIQSGRCTSLHGPSGAYDTYEKEKRADLIIDKLDKMMTKLDEIKGMNIMLYHAMKGVNNSLNAVYTQVIEQTDAVKELGAGIEKSIGVLEQNTAANNLLLQVTNQNLQQIKEFEEYQTFVTKQQRLKDGYWH